MPSYFRCEKVRGILSGKTKPFCSLPHLSVSYTERMKGQSVSAQTIANWIMTCITMAYGTAQIMLPKSLQAHSTRAKATSLAVLINVSIVDISRAATWS